MKVLQVVLTFQTSPADFERAMAPLAEAVAAVPGLSWKLGLIDPEHGEACDVYLFADDTSLQAYLDGPIVAGLKTHPLLSAFSLRQFDVMDSIDAGTALNVPIQGEFGRRYCDY